MGPDDMTQLASFLLAKRMVIEEAAGAVLHVLPFVNKVAVVFVDECAVTVSFCLAGCVGVVVVAGSFGADVSWSVAVVVAVDALIERADDEMDDEDDEASSDMCKLRLGGFFPASRLLKS